MKPRLFTPETEESPPRPTAIRGAHLALALIAVAGIGVTVFANFGETNHTVVTSLAIQRVAAYWAGIVYLLAAAIVHSLTFCDLRRDRPTCRRAARLLLASHGIVALAVLYSFAVRRLTSHALLVGLDPLLSSAAILSVLACVVALAMVTQRPPTDSRNGLRRTRVFAGVCFLFAASLVWLEFSPLQ